METIKASNKRKQIKRVVIILPTYNEAGNINNMIDSIFDQAEFISPIEIKLLVVDDSSPDGTGKIVKEKQKQNHNLYLLSGSKQGLGNAYIRGFKYTLNKLDADIVFQMDADLSHDPKLIPQFVSTIINGADFVIGSRYITGGSIPDNWFILRKLNSKVGNLIARSNGNLRRIHDCTSGYRSIRSDFLKQIDLDSLNTKGYVFLVNLLYLASKNKANIVEIPLNFKDRISGESKLNTKDIIEFIKYIIILNIKSIDKSQII